MFQATMCPSSGENTVPTRHLVFVTLYRWLSGMHSFIPPCIPDSHLYRVTNTRCRIGTVFSPDDGHVVARNMYSKATNILQKTVHQVGSICNIAGALVKKNFSPLQKSRVKEQYTGEEIFFESWLQCW